MMTVEINTTGSVGNIFWADLTPFTQGYIEALFADLQAAVDASSILDKMRNPTKCYGLWRCAFRDLAPETLARIIADCEAGVDLPFMLGRAYNANDAGGRCFWRDRQAGILTAFPPLTVHLGDDGKVRFV